MIKILMLFLFMINVCFANNSLRDPTIPIDNVSAKDHGNEQINLKIQGLFVSKSKRIALIDDKFYVVGDLTKVGELVAILKDRVVVKQGDIMNVIFMSKQKVRNDI